MFICTGFSAGGCFGFVPFAIGVSVCWDFCYIRLVIATRTMVRLATSGCACRSKVDCPFGVVIVTEFVDNDCFSRKFCFADRTINYAIVVTFFGAGRFNTIFNYCFGRFVTEGVNCSGFGMSADKKTLYILVADGRQPNYSLGISTREVAEFLKYLGASDGLNMDGGGSTTLLLRKGKNLLKLNYHAYKQERATGINYERAVGGCMGIILKD